MQNINENIICPNCEKNPGTGKFCLECGQENKPLRLNLVVIFGEIFSVIFNINNKFFRTLKAAFVPGKLASAFIKGKRKMYLHPLRFFFYSWILLALIMNANFNGIDAKNDMIKGFIEGANGNNNISENFYSKDFDLVFEGNQYLFTRDTSKYQKSIGVDSLIVILYQDLETLKNKQFFKKYKVETWKEKFFFKRIKRFGSNPIKTVLTFVIDHFIWLFLLVIPFSALSLTLLFRRSKRYYSEHILYLMYLYGIFFVIISLIIILSHIGSYDNNLYSITEVISLILLFLFWIYSFFSLKNFYNRKIWKTIWTWVLYLFMNIFIFLIGGSVYFAISIFLF